MGIGCFGQELRFVGECFIEDYEVVVLEERRDSTCARTGDQVG